MVKKKMENLRKKLDLRLVTNEKDYLNGHQNQVL